MYCFTLGYMPDYLLARCSDLMFLHFDVMVYYSSQQSNCNHTVVTLTTQKQKHPISVFCWLVYLFKMILHLTASTYNWKKQYRNHLMFANPKWQTPNLGFKCRLLWRKWEKRNYCLPSNDLLSGSETWRPCGMTHLPWPHPEIPDWLLCLALSNDWLPQTTPMKPFGLWLWLSENPWPSSRPGSKLISESHVQFIKKLQKRNSLLIRFF